MTMHFVAQPPQEQAATASAAAAAPATARPEPEPRLMRPMTSRLLAQSEQTTTKSENLHEHLASGHRLAGRNSKQRILKRECFYLKSRLRTFRWAAAATSALGLPLLLCALALVLASCPHGRVAAQGQVVASSHSRGSRTETSSTQDTQARPPWPQWAQDSSTGRAGGGEINLNKTSGSSSSASGPNGEELSSSGVNGGGGASAKHVNEKEEKREKQKSTGGGQFAGLRQDELHKLMSEKDLRRTFHVERHDEVPEYQILKLSVARDGSHLISPISDLGELLVTSGSSSGRTGGSLRGGEEDSQEERAARVKRSSGAQESLAESPPKQQQQQQKLEANEKPNAKAGGPAGSDKQLLVLSLSTFGRDFSLRLKRNADFQQRIKDMKMFLAESMGDGQLKYTEIKPNHHQQHQQQHSHHKQEPHKRAATASEAAAEEEEQRQRDKRDDKQQKLEGDSPTTTTTTTTTTAGDRADAKTSPQAPAGGANKTADHRPAEQARQQHDWLGSAYHDEENLAAILIERDRRTGQLKLDGTIGNEFVIKPMPRATIEALLAKQQQQQVVKQRERAEAAAEMNSIAGAARDLERSPSTPSTAASSTDTPPGAQQQAQKPAASGSAAERAAAHLHDDDPHDDDEMFLDEDEALELAHLQASAASVESNHTTTATSSSSNLPQQALLASGGGTNSNANSAGRPLSKAASERKWKKYRKLMAQTQVPKLARRHAGDQPSSSNNHHQRAPEQVADHQLISHHIVFRQRPSSEASSSEHQHSFMFAPGQQTMEQMARRFSPEVANSRLAKRSTGDNMIEPGRRLPAGELAGASEADFAHDPMGGQFYLEPASMTGFERAGFADWSLMSRPGGHTRALPPYALNSTSSSDEMFASSVASNRTDFTTTGGHQQQQQRLNATHARYKRHAGGPRGLRGAGSRPPPALAPSHGRRHKRQAPDVVWPEVLLVVDYDSFLLHGGDSREVKRYFVSFWNGVDLRYKLLVNPHIRISLAGMIVAKDRDATPYLERNRLRAPNADAVDAAGALTDMGKYLYREDRLPTYDLAVVITKLDMCRRRYEGGRCNRGTAGFAYVGGACVVNKRLEKVNSVAIIEDSGGFSGIIVAAHEVGHLLGCVHDGSPPPSYLGGPGATHCPWEDGFIMSDLRHTERGFRWSQCSVEQFKHFLNGETATCLYNYPHESQMLHRLLPGSMLSLDDQCKRDRGTNACFKDARVCAQLFCFDSASGYCVSYRPAAEGSPCGDGHVCRNGKCVGEIENIIPDYTHQSQTVVAAAGRGAGRPLVVGGPSALLPPPRLADNGLSASSTSTATSSPDNKLASSSGSGSSSSSAPQISSRMDSFAEGPNSGEFTPTQSAAAYQQQQPGGYHPAGFQSNLNKNRQPAAYQAAQHYGAPAHGSTLKSAKLVQQPQVVVAGARPRQQQQISRRAEPLSGTSYATDLSQNFHLLQSQHPTTASLDDVLGSAAASLAPQHHQQPSRQGSSSSSHGKAGQANSLRRYQQSFNYQPGVSSGSALLTSASSLAPFNAQTSAKQRVTRAGGPQAAAAAANGRELVDINENSNLFSSSNSPKHLSHSTQLASGSSSSSSTPAGRSTTAAGPARSHTPQPPAISVAGASTTTTTTTTTTTSASTTPTTRKRHAQVQQSSARQLAPNQRLQYRSTSALTPTGPSNAATLNHHHNQGHSLDQAYQNLQQDHHHHHHHDQPLSPLNYDYFSTRQQQPSAFV